MRTGKCGVQNFTCAECTRSTIVSWMVYELLNEKDEAVMKARHMMIQ